MDPKCAQPNCPRSDIGDGMYCPDHSESSNQTRKIHRVKRMSQSDVVSHFADMYGMKRAQVKELFEELSNLAAEEVKNNGEFTLPGFGKLVLAQRHARQGRNPSTGETIQIPARTTLKFRVGKNIKDIIVQKK